VRSGVFQLSAPVRLGEREGATLRERAAITVILEATVTRIGLSANGASVERLHVARSKGGGAFTVAARTVVLATGGIENARLLLASRDVAPAGVGNDHDLVGRYFMEHAHTDGYAVLLVAGGPDRMRFYDRRARGGQEVWPFLGLSPEVRAREGLLDFSLVLLLKNPGETGELGADVDGAVRAFSGRGEDPAACTFALGTPSECAPNPDSRVMLAEEADALGVPRVRLDWRLTELDKRTVARGHELVARALAASGVGRLRLRLDEGPDFPDVTMGGCHHMGTTRMHDDPARGVVDRNLKVHGVANLYVAGSSVFPTAGAPNPTLTLTALSMRLADHLLQVTA
jgi:choline dehydrogenase-like flavoprotein